ncbi:cyclohexanecarboxylate-CoA ligase [Nocardia nova]|uniref:Cyclohexanecarboxylate-CoA ligase n=1 Tax=Nocardia nova TaxID=37330 RepID=A0A2S6AQ66_9NOCA|nr:AMP-binding protein [Nocardia nova]PPI94112.1 cyclohexanecarboxylate-CoA ligase [Nocardia nova]PPJ26568.1 cyclohexanecarboxylate-CoA ligase [Nocardia nova]PPJ37368.1 cyclohexanecarboxylate-CoA ligase [Nocardia nova]
MLVDPAAAVVNDTDQIAAEGIWDLIRERAQRSAGLPMLVDEHGTTLTFGEFRARAERVAAALRAEGIGPGSRVAWQLPTRISTLLVMAALARLGAVQAPIIPIYRERETGAAVAAAEADTMLIPGTWRGTDYRAMAEGLPGTRRVLTIGMTAPESADVVALPPEPGVSQDIRWIYFTSGSSGLPKGACHGDSSLLAAARGFTQRGGLGREPGEVGGIPFPVAHVGGVLYLMSLLLVGFPAVVVEAFDSATTSELFRRHRVTFTGGSTVFYNALLNEQRKLPPGERLLPSLRLLKGGGAPCPPSVYHAVRAELNATVAHDYGATEVPMICVASPDDTDEQLANTEGRPIPGLRLRVVGAAGELPLGQDGEIQVQGASVFRGYTDPELTAAAFTADGWFRTGDLGHLRSDGHVEVTGRLKDMIIRKGENIGPVEVEALLAEHPAVAEVAVIGLPDDERGELVCAVIAVRPGAATPTLDEVAAHLRRAGLMPQKLPERLEVLAELPKTGLGKLDKQSLRRTFSGA